MGIGSAIAHPVASAVRRLDSQKGANLPGEGPRLLSILAAWIRAFCDEHKAKVVYFASMGMYMHQLSTNCSQFGRSFFALAAVAPRCGSGSQNQCMFLYVYYKSRKSKTSYP